MVVVVVVVVVVVDDVCGGGWDGMGAVVCGAPWSLGDLGHSARAGNWRSLVGGGWLVGKSARCNLQVGGSAV